MGAEDSLCAAIAEYTQGLDEIERIDYKIEALIPCGSADDRIKQKIAERHRDYRVVRRMLKISVSRYLEGKDWNSVMIRLREYRVGFDKRSLELNQEIISIPLD